MKVDDYQSWQRNSPRIEPAELLAGRPLLVIAPHPDDESLGCGGLIAWASEQGVAITIVFLTQGERSHEGSHAFPSHALARLRHDEAVSAAAQLGVSEERLHFLNLPDGGLGHMDDETLEAIHFSLLGVVATELPPLICVTSRTDRHCDHQAAWLIAQRLAKSCGATALGFPIWTWMLDPQGDIAVPPRRAWRLATRNPTRKRSAIAAHRSQLGGVIDDATTPFVIPEALLDIVCLHDEVFIDDRL